MRRMQRKAHPDFGKKCAERRFAAAASIAVSPQCPPPFLRFGDASKPTRIFIFALGDQQLSIAGHDWALVRLGSADRDRLGEFFRSEKVGRRSGHGTAVAEGTIDR
jgi:hypothetical protein